MKKMENASIWKKYSYAWVTLGFFLFSLIGHWLFGWFAFANEQSAHGQQADLIPYLVEMGRDTLENWQSEFLQLLWQIGGLAYLFYVGSPQSKEGDDRVEAKLDEALRLLSPERAEQIIAAIDKEYAGRHTDPAADKKFS
jgi:hypothetical protein